MQGEAGRVEAELGEPREFTREEQRQRFLENEIHKTTLVHTVQQYPFHSQCFLYQKMMEADMVRKKYDIILDMLRQVRTALHCCL